MTLSLSSLFFFKNSQCTVNIMPMEGQCGMGLWMNIIEPQCCNKVLTQKPYATEIVSGLQVQNIDRCTLIIKML